MLVKDRLEMFPCLRDHMIRAIERDTVAKHQPHVRNELFSSVVTGIVGVGIWLGGTARQDLPLNGAEIHRILDDGRVMGNIEGNRVNGTQKRAGFLVFLQRTYRGQEESVLRSADGRDGGTNRSAHRSRWCWSWTGCNSITIGLLRGCCDRRGRASL